MTDDAERWNRRYRDAGADADADRPAAADVLNDNAFLLPDRGDALDLACGLGGNALLLAERGLRSHGWDVSEVAIERLRSRAAAAGLRVAVEVRDVVAAPPPPVSFDVIVVSRFLDRSLMPALFTALRPRGLLFYQTFCRLKTDPQVGPKEPDYLLDDNELLNLCGELRVRAYRDNALTGRPDQGLRNSAWLVGEKP